MDEAQRLAREAGGMEEAASLGGPAKILPWRGLPLGVRARSRESFSRPLSALPIHHAAGLEALRRLKPKGRTPPWRSAARKRAPNTRKRQATTSSAKPSTASYAPRATTTS